MELVFAEAREPGSSDDIVLTKDAALYFAWDSCKTPVNVQDVQGRGFQMAVWRLGSFLVQLVLAHSVGLCEQGYLLGN